MKTPTLTRKASIPSGRYALERSLFKFIMWPIIHLRTMSSNVNASHSPIKLPNSTWSTLWAPMMTRVQLTDTPIQSDMIKAVIYMHLPWGFERMISMAIAAVAPIHHMACPLGLPNPNEQDHDSTSEYSKYGLGSWNACFKKLFTKPKQELKKI